MNKAKNVLVIAAHPDDEVLGCGATMAKHAFEGSEVWSLILGEGITSRFSKPGKGTKPLLKKLWASAEKANRSLGVRRLIQRQFPDNAFDRVPRLEIIHEIESVIEELKPSVVYTHNPSDLNIDHQLCSEAVQTACRPIPGHPVKRVLAFEVVSSTEWRFGGGDPFRPNVFVDVARFLSRKLDAMKHYAGELRPFPHARSLENLEALAKFRGAQSGVLAAEAFCLLRESL